MTLVGLLPSFWLEAQSTPIVTGPLPKTFARCARPASKSLPRSMLLPATTARTDALAPSSIKRKRTRSRPRAHPRRGSSTISGSRSDEHHDKHCDLPRVGSVCMGMAWRRVMTKWAVWVPWERCFREQDFGVIMLFDTEERARAYCGEGSNFRCLHGATPPGCKQCWYQAVPWDARAQAIACGKIVL